MKNIRSVIFVTSILLFVFLPVSRQSVWAKTIDEQLAEVEKSLDLLQKALAPLKNEYSQLETKIDSNKKQVSSIEVMVNRLSKELFNKEVDLGVKKEVMAQKTRRYYINLKTYSPLSLFFSARSPESLVFQLGWYQSVLDRNRREILQVSGQITQLNKQKSQLGREKQRLAQLKKGFEKRASFLGKEINKAEEYRATLTARQQELVRLKTELFSTSVGETPSVDDPCSGAPGSSNFCAPGFSPAFAVFSFGAPHRKGMSQYGAYGRAKSGQGFEQIIKAYYGDVRIEAIASPGSINTSIGSLPFEDNYLMGIAEMPSSWGDKGGMEALKAQAIAARTYSLSYVNWRMGSRLASGSICTSESCQVYSSNKANNAPSTWREAVSSTRNKIIVSNKTGEIISAWYASTAGGAIYGYSTLGHQTPSIWDTSCGNKSCWPDQAYEKTSASPWFYKGWYRTRSGKSCGRGSPWLTQEEMADILNAVLVYTHDKGTLGYLSQTDATSCWGGGVTATWSKDKLRQEAARFGGPISHINSVSVDYSTSGVTAQIKAETDKGGFSFSGQDFKMIFNLRAPGAIHAKSMLFNLVKN